MPFVVPEAVLDYSSSIGTGTFTVDGTPPSGFRGLASAGLVAGELFPYRIRHLSLNQWENGFGTYLSAGQFTRSRIRASSNSNAVVNFSQGVKEVLIPSSPLLVEDRITPEMYGAVGDGVADDTVAMQAAFNAATGGIVLECPGDAVYRITSTLSFPTQFHLEAGNARFFFDKTDGGNMISAAGTANATINLNTTAPAQQRYFDLVSSSGIVRGDFIYVIDNTVYDPSNSVKQGEIRQVRYNAGSRISLDAPLRATYSTASSARAAKVVMLEDITINGGRWYGRPITGLDPLGAGVFVGGSLFRHGWLVLQLCNRVKLSPKLVSDFDFIGVTTRDCLNVSISGLIQNNMGATGYAVSIENACDNVFADGLIVHNCFVGVAQGSATGLVGGSLYGITRNSGARNCHIYGTIGGDALATHSASEDMVFANNTIEGNALFGIFVNGGSANISNNVISGARSKGIFAAHECSSQFRKPYVIEGNLVTLTSNLGVRVTIPTVTGFFHPGETVTQSGSGATGIVVGYLNSPGGNILQIDGLSGSFNNSGMVTGAQTGATGAASAVSAADAAVGIFCGGNALINGNSVTTFAINHKPIDLFGFTFSVIGNYTFAPAGATVSAITMASSGTSVLSGNVLFCNGASAGGVFAMSGGATSSDKYAAGGGNLGTSTGYLGGFANWTSG